jgi:hypothetical protein
MEEVKIHPDRRWGPPYLFLDGYSVSFPCMKRPVRNLDYHHPPSEEVKNEWSYYLTPPSHRHDVGGAIVTFLHFKERCYCDEEISILNHV